MTGDAEATDDEHPLDNAVWWALATEHEGFAEVKGTARRYPADVSVFSGVERLDAEGWEDLAALAGPGGTLALFRDVVGEPPVGWTVHHRGRGHQMVVDAATLAPLGADDEPVPVIRRLTVEDVTDMLSLVVVSRPGPFEVRTVEMGRYWGVVEGGELVAMAGERLHLTGHAEISAVTTHPEARGRGLARALTRHVALAVLERGEVPFLHVAVDNVGARRVYERLGFRERRLVEFAFLEAPPAP